MYVLEHFRVEFSRKIKFSPCREKRSLIVFAYITLLFDLNIFPFQKAQLLSSQWNMAISTVLMV